MRFDAGIADHRQRVARRPARGIVIDDDVGHGAGMRAASVAPSLCPIARNLALSANASISSIGSASSKLRSEEHTSELPSLMRISYAVFCLKKKTQTKLINK